MKFSHDDSVINVNLVPLLDTIFIILVFFTIILISASFTEIIPIDVPVSASGNPVSLTMQTITIEKNGTLYLNAKVMPLDELSNKIALQPENTFMIRGDTRASFGAVIAVLDVLGKCGAKNVYFEVTPQ